MSRVRLTGGSARGRVVREPVGPGIRPTSSRVREALFSVLGQNLQGLTVLDAFGGAGLIGLEAWSRGATVTVVERDAKAFRGLQRRGAELGADWTLIRGDILRKASSLPPFAGVFCDPPYDDDPAGILDVLGPLARIWFVYEARAGVELPEQVGELTVDRPRQYGQTALWIYR